MNNIFFKGKRYNVGDPVLVDDKEEMNAARWETEKEYLTRVEKVAKDTMGLTEKESTAKIVDLTSKLEKAEADNKSLKEELEKRDAEIAELKKGDKK